MSNMKPVRRVNKRRVKILQEFLNNLPDENVDLNVYCERSFFSNVAGRYFSKHSKSFAEIKDQLSKEHTCDTIGCIAGWTVVLFGPESWKVNPGSSMMIDNDGREINIAYEAKKLLVGEGYNAARLFDQNVTGKPDREEINNRLNDLIKHGSKSMYIRKEEVRG